MVSTRQIMMAAAGLRRRAGRGGGGARAGAGPGLKAAGALGAGPTEDAAGKAAEAERRCPSSTPTPAPLRPRRRLPNPLRGACHPASARHPPPSPQHPFSLFLPRALQRTRYGPLSRPQSNHIPELLDVLLFALGCCLGPGRGNR